MSTTRKHFTYDTIEDEDIHEWMESLPKRGQSKFIRVAIREYLKTEKSKQHRTEQQTHIKQEHSQQSEAHIAPEDKAEEDTFVDLQSNLLSDLGK